MADTSICDRTAVELAGLVRKGEISARELLAAHLERIEAVNLRLNAIVTLVPERAEVWAGEADERQARGEPLGPLHGLPIAHKDLLMTEGIRSTRGSPLLANHIPKHDDLIITRLRAAGAITIGKTNVPEFGGGLPDVQPRVWRDPEPMGSRQDLRRQQWGRRRGVGDGTSGHLGSVWIYGGGPAGRDPDRRTPS